MARARRPRGRKSLLSVQRSDVDELRAAVLAMKAADKSLRKDLNARARATLGPAWTQGLADHSSAYMDRLILQGARVAGGNPPQLIAGNSKKKIGRGLVPVQHWAYMEYGAVDVPETYTRTSPKGLRHQVTRRTRAGARRRAPGGHVIGPTLKKYLPRLAALWCQTVARTYLDAIERK